jgi:hypothetical protein
MPSGVPRSATACSAMCKASTNAYLVDVGVSIASSSLTGGRAFCMAAAVTSVYAPLFSKALAVLLTPAMASLYSLAGVLELPPAALFAAVLTGAFLPGAFLTEAFFGVGLARFDAFVTSPVVSESVSLFYMSLMSVTALSALLRVVRVVVESGVKNEAMEAGGMVAGLG